MRIALFGGSGFIGARLCCRLSKNNSGETLIYDIRQPLEQEHLSGFNYCDVSKKINDDLLGASDVIVNLAAEHRDDVTPKSLYDRVNVDGAVNICNLAVEKDISTIVFTSSVAVYGFAVPGIGESGAIRPFNDYGRTKWEAEQIYRKWQAQDSSKRSLVIVRPTVVFGEGNRGNVYNLLRQIASGHFLMIGDGLNQKSLAYVENVAAFLEHSISFGPGLHIYNYVDKPDFSMNNLIAYVNNVLGRKKTTKFRVPFMAGMIVGLFFDLMSKFTGRKFTVSAVRVRKFCADSIYSSSIDFSKFSPPIPLTEAIEKTIVFEFIESR